MRGRGGVVRVLQEMLRSARSPGAADVLGTDVVIALDGLDSTLRQLPGQVSTPGRGTGRGAGSASVVAV